MSKSEDYLEELLKTMDEPQDTETDLDEDFFNEDLFEDDLLEADLLDEEFMDEDLTDDFLKNFEMALEEMDEKNAAQNELEESGSEESEYVEELFGNLDSIISGTSDVSEIANEDFVVEDFSDDDVGMDALSAMMETSEEENVAESIPELIPEPQVDDTEADVLKILEGLGDIDLELEMNNEGERSEESVANDNALLDFLSADAMMGSENPVEDTLVVDENNQKVPENDKKKKKSSKKEDKKGFFSKLGTILFGEDEEEAEASKPVEKAANTSEQVLEGGAVVQEFTDDALDLFKDFATVPSAPSKEERAEEDKKKKKKKDKKEKVKKEKKPKPKKEKKPKKPKEPDNSPPLPKKPVMLILIMVASFVALILIGTNLLGYHNSMTSAKNAFAKKNYTEAYSYVSAMEIKEVDIPLYEKYQTMAMISSEYDAYKNLMAGEFYDMALDSLVRMVGRCDKFREDALIYECINELNALEAEAESILNETFKMTKEEAIELYNYRDRRDYSKALNAILKELGMEKVIEE